MSCRRAPESRECLRLLQRSVMRSLPRRVNAFGIFQFQSRNWFREQNFPPESEGSFAVTSRAIATVIVIIIRSRWIPGNALIKKDHRLMRRDLKAFLTTFAGHVVVDSDQIVF